MKTFYKFGKSSKEVAAKCYEHHNHIEHILGKTVSDPSSMLSVTDPQGLLIHLMWGYGDQFIKVLVNEENLKLNSAVTSAYSCDEYIVQEVSDIRNRSTIDEIIALVPSDVYFVQSELDRFKNFMDKIDAIDTYYYFVSKIFMDSCGRMFVH